MIWKAEILVIVISFAMQYMNCNGAVIKPYFEDISIEFVNETYIDKDTYDVSINYKPNGKNSFNIRVDVIKEFPKDLYIKMDVSSRAFGHDIPTGLSFHSKVCDEGLAKIFYDSVIRPFGVKECPPEKGSFVVEDFVPDFPDIPGAKFIPGSRLVADTKIHAENIQIFHLKSLIVV